MKYIISLLLLLVILAGCNLDGTGLFYDVAHSQPASEHSNMNLLWADGQKAYVQAVEGILLYEKQGTATGPVTTGTKVTLIGLATDAARIYAQASQNADRIIVFTENSSGKITARYEVDISSGGTELALGTSTAISNYDAISITGDFGSYAVKENNSWSINGSVWSVLAAAQFVDILDNTSSVAAVATTHGKYSVSINNAAFLKFGTTTDTDITEKPVAYLGNYLVTYNESTSTGTLWLVSAGTATSQETITKLSKTIVNESSRSIFTLCLHDPRHH